MNLLPFLITFLLVIILTPVIKKFAIKLNYVDRADGDPLKIHKNPTPLLGGLAVIISILAGLLANRLLYPQIEFVSLQFYGIIFGAVIIFLVGSIDDLKKLTPSTRLFTQIIVGVIITAVGFQIHFIPLVKLSLISTVFFMAAMINAYNFIDGMDGLCTGLAIITCVGFLIIGYLSSNLLIVGVAGFLLAALIGFLPYNFHVASIFLGDAGSGLIGFLVGLLATFTIIKPFDFLSAIGVFLIIGLPIFDIVFAVVRRLKNRKPLFNGDRSHTYDFLLGKGLSQRSVWSLLCAIQAISTISGVLIYKFL
jgi:UDP-GlcNAc:undecaprenyl-phosphate GlcNAc-1-phosphate transferase